MILKSQCLWIVKLHDCCWIDWLTQYRNKIFAVWWWNLENPWLSFCIIVDDIIKGGQFSIWWVRYCAPLLWYCGTCTTNITITPLPFATWGLKFYITNFCWSNLLKMQNVEHIVKSFFEPCTKTLSRLCVCTYILCWWKPRASLWCNWGWSLPYTVSSHKSGNNGSNMRAGFS